MVIRRYQCVKHCHWVSTIKCKDTNWHAEGGGGNWDILYWVHFIRDYINKAQGTLIEQSQFDVHTRGHSCKFSVYKQSHILCTQNNLFGYCIVNMASI